MYSLFIGMALLVGHQLVGAQNAQLFRILGPTATTVTAFNSDGTIIWSGATAGATYLVQTADSLGGADARGPAGTPTLSQTLKG
jgi:hypothetical protein